MSLYEITAAFSATDGISGIVSNIGSNISNMGQQAMQASGGMEEGFNAAALASGALGLGVMAVGAAAMIGVNQMEEVNSSMSRVAVRTGQSKDEMKGFEQATKDVFNTGLTKNFDEAAHVIEVANNALTDLGANSPQVKQFATDALGMGKAWSTSGEQIARTGMKMMQDFKDLAGKPTEALDILTRAAQQTGKPLDVIEGYVTRFGPKFAAAGISALEMGGLIVVGSNIGMSDKGIGGLSTALELFHNNLANPSAKFTAALKDMGLSGVVADLKANKITMDTALTDIGKAFEDGPQSGAKKAQDAAILFGTQVNTIGLDPFMKTLAMAKDALGGADGVKGAADDAAAAMQDDGTLGTAIGKLANNLKTNLGDAADTVYKAFKNADWGGAFNQIGVIAGQKKDGIVNSVKGMVDGASKTWTDWFGAGGKVVTAVDEAFSQVQQYLGNAISMVSGPVQDVVNAAKGIWNDLFGSNSGLVKAVADAWTGVEAAVSGAVAGVQKVFTAIANAAAGALNPIIAAINQIIEGINRISGAMGGGMLPTISPIPMKAAGGPLEEGWNIVGEQGPELISKSGASATVFSNSQSQKMVKGSGGGGGGSNTYITIQAGTVVGSDGMSELSRMIYVKQQDEAKRRGLSS